jgi:hypothetical protein
MPAEVSGNITSRTDFALTAAGFLGVYILTICTCEPLNYSVLLLALGSARNSCMAMFVHCSSDRRGGPERLIGTKLIKADTPDKHVATRFKKDCLSCYVPAQSTDWLCAQGYPVVKSK